MVHSYNMRSERSLFTIGWFTNRKLCQATAISTLVVVVVTFVPPVALAFGLTQLPALYYLWALLLILVPLPVLEIAKAITRARRGKAS